MAFLLPDFSWKCRTAFNHNLCTEHFNHEFFFLQSFREGRNIFVTQYPLQNTIGDLWSLVYDNDCRTIVILDELSEVNYKYLKDKKINKAQLTLR